MHLISVDAQGQFTTLVILDGSNELLNFEFSTDENNAIAFTITENGIDDILNTANPQDIKPTYFLFETIQPGSYVALPSPDNSFELFFILKVLSTEISIQQL